MKNYLRKISALMITGTMVLGLHMTALAATTTNGVLVANETTVDIQKDIILHNTDGRQIYPPAVTYNYAIAPGAAGKIVEDAAGHKGTVKAGIANGVTLTDSTAVFANTVLHDAAATGSVISDNITASVDLTKFNSAGIYRYIITETEPANLTALGITRPDGYVNTRTLDVYIENDGTGLKVAGYVVYISGDQNINANEGDTELVNGVTGKTTGFVQQYDANVDPDETDLQGAMADEYYTYNLVVEKEITGALADKTHEFPFVVTTSGVAAQPITVTTTGTTLVGVTDGKGTVGTDIRANLGTGKNITIVGLPANTEFNIQETNDTPDVYKVTVADTTATPKLRDAVSVQAAGTLNASDDALKISTYTNKDTAANALAQNYSDIKYTNNLDAVSPTGVVLRYAPYIIMFGAAIVLLVFTRRRRHADEA